MKNTFLKTIGTALAILILTVSAQTRVFAQEDSKTEDQQNTGQTLEDLSVRGAHSEKVVGTWDVQVTIRNCQTGAALITFPSTTTLMAGGTVLDSTSGIPQALKTPGHGVWSYVRGNIYRFKTKSFSFDASGNFTGWTIISHEVYLHRRADGFESTGTAMIYAPNGSLITTGCSTTVSTRFE